MARNFEELRRKMSPERRARNQAETQRLLAEMPTPGPVFPDVGNADGNHVTVGELRRFAAEMGGTVQITFQLSPPHARPPATMAG